MLAMYKEAPCPLPSKSTCTVSGIRVPLCQQSLGDMHTYEIESFFLTFCVYCRKFSRRPSGICAVYLSQFDDNRRMILIPDNFTRYQGIIHRRLSQSSLCLSQSSQCLSQSSQCLSMVGTVMFLGLNL